MKNSKKIIILGIILLVLAGIIVVSLKGFHVSLMFGKHEAVEIKIGKEVNQADIKQICSEVFGNKKYVVKELEVFGESTQINVESITDEEKENLLNKINEKYETEKSADDLKVYAVSNTRIRDVVKPYLGPMMISFATVFIFMLIRYRRMEAWKIIFGFVYKVVLLEAILLSIIAIGRIPVNSFVINLLMMMAVIGIMYTLYQNEKKLGIEEEE